MKQITISGIIGWDSTPDQLRQDLAAANGDDVEFVVSSPGGFVGDGLEMFNLIRNYAGKTVARLSGYAMSMASYLPLAADRIVAEDNAIFMIHNVRGGVFGDHNDILKYGEMTAAMSRMLARAYAKHTGKSLDEIQAMMDKETYLFGQDMVDYGFVHEIISTDEDSDRETACTTARIACESCYAKMTADISAVKNDLTRAAALAGTEGSINQPRAQEKPQPAKKGDSPMNLEKLKQEHPDLVAAIVAEAQTGMAEAVNQAQEAGAKAEQQRIADVRAQAIPGHEALIETLAFDGKTTGAEAAMAMVGAEKSLREKALAEITGEANGVVAAAEGGDGTVQTMKRAVFNALGIGEQRAFVKDGGKVIE